MVNKYVHVCVVCVCVHFLILYFPFGRFVLPSFRNTYATLEDDNVYNGKRNITNAHSRRASCILKGGRKCTIGGNALVEDSGGRTK